MTGSLYIIRNIKNKKAYVGITFQSPSERRWRQHKTVAKTNRKILPLYKSIRKHGIENFLFEVLVFDVDENTLYFLEEEMIRLLKLKNKNKGYNLSDGGKVNKGYKMPKSLIEFRKSLVGEKASFYGKHHTPESKELLSRANLGRKVREDVKTRISQSHKKSKKSPLYNKGEKHPSFGRKRPEIENKSIRKNMPHRKEVVMLNEKSNIVMKFLSLKQAGKWIQDNIDWVTNKNQRSIATSIKRSINNDYFAYGYKWRFYEKSQETIPSDD